MTMAPPQPSPDASDVPVESAGPAPFPDAVNEWTSVHRVVRQRTVARRRRRRRLLVVQSSLTVLFVVGLVVLAYMGYRATLGITGGTEKVTDPEAPGYVAEARPTSVSLIVFDAYPFGQIELDPEIQDPMPIEEGRNLMTMLMVVQRPGGLPPTITPIPAQLQLWQFEDSEPATAAEVFGTGGVGALSTRLGAGLTFGTTESVTVSEDMLVRLGELAGPLTVEVPDDVLVAIEWDPPQFEVRYPHGALTLQPSELPDYFSFRGDRETNANFALRLDLAWQQLIEQAAANGGALSVDASDPEQEAFAEVMSAVLSSETTVASLPYATSAEGGNDAARLGLPEGVNSSAMAPWVTANLPFPISAYPGQRIKVELLNGTESPDAVRGVAPLIVATGAEIAWTGNAESFDVAETRVEYSRAELEPAAAAIAESLGVSATRNPDLDAIGEVVVVVGTDR